MTDGSKKNKKRRRGRGIQRSGASIRLALSPFFFVSFVFPVEFLICRIVTRESEGSGTEGQQDGSQQVQFRFSFDIRRRNERGTM